MDWLPAGRSDRTSSPTPTPSDGSPISLASAPVLSLGVGIIYGMFVELDDGGDKAEPAVKKAKRA